MTIANKLQIEIKVNKEKMEKGKLQFVCMYFEVMYTVRVIVCTLRIIAEIGTESKNLSNILLASLSYRPLLMIIDLFARVAIICASRPYRHFATPSKKSALAR